MDDNKIVKKLEDFEEEAKNRIPPSDLESGDYVQVHLNREEARKLKELLSKIIKQL